jgi:hypothetical protein
VRILVRNDRPVGVVYSIERIAALGSGNMRTGFSARNGELAGCQPVRTTYCATMATNLDVDIRAIETLMQLGDFRSKREAVDAAVAEAIAYRKQLKALEFLGTIDFTAQLAASPATEVD